MVPYFSLAMVNCDASVTHTHVRQSASGWHPRECRGMPGSRPNKRTNVRVSRDLQHGVAHVHGLIEVVLHDLISDLLKPRLTI